MNTVQKHPIERVIIYSCRLLNRVPVEKKDGALHWQGIHHFVTRNHIAKVKKDGRSTVGLEHKITIMVSRIWRKRSYKEYTFRVIGSYIYIGSVRLSVTDEIRLLLEDLVRRAS